jgi:hypothetical protein
MFRLLPEDRERAVDRLEDGTRARGVGRRRDLVELLAVRLADDGDARQVLRSRLLAGILTAASDEDSRDDARRET